MGHYTLRSSSRELEVTEGEWRSVLFAQYLRDVALFWMVVSVAIPMLYARFGRTASVTDVNEQGVCRESVSKPARGDE